MFIVGFCIPLSSRFRSLSLRVQFDMLIREKPLDVRSIPRVPSIFAALAAEDEQKPEQAVPKVRRLFAVLYLCVALSFVDFFYYDDIHSLVPTCIHDSRMTR